MASFKVQTHELDSGASLLSSFAEGLSALYSGSGADATMEDPQLRSAMAQVVQQWTARIDQTMSDLYSLADALSGASGHYLHTDAKIAGNANDVGGQCTTTKPGGKRPPNLA